MPFLELKADIYFIWRCILPQWCQGKKVQRCSPSPSPAGMRRAAVGKSWPLSGMLSPAFLEPRRVSPPARPHALRRHRSLGSARVTPHAEGLGVWSGGGSGAAATPRPGLIRSGAARLTVGPEPRAQSRGEEGGGTGNLRVTQPDWPMSAEPWVPLTNRKREIYEWHLRRAGEREPGS